MRQLSFVGYLEPYVKRLSFREGDEKTGSLRVLAREVENEHNYRLLYPLVLLAYLTERMHLLAAEAVPDGILGPELRLMAFFAGKDALLAELERQRYFLDSPLGNEYLKAWESYRVSRDRKAGEAELKLAIRTRVRPLMAQLGLTPGGVARTLGLSRAAVWDWLERGNPHSLSREAVGRVTDYVDSQAGHPKKAPANETPYAWRDDVAADEQRFLSRLEGLSHEDLLKRAFRLGRQASRLDLLVEEIKMELRRKNEWQG